MGLYRLLLYFYPASFRREYGKQMTAVFRDRRLAVSNPFEWMLFWFDVIVDTALNGAATHIDILRQDLKYSARTLGRAPGFTITAILVGALGIGATTATVAIVDHVLIRPLRFAEPDRLVELTENHESRGTVWELSPADYRDWKKATTSFQSMGAYVDGLSFNLVGQGNPQTIGGASVTSEVFPCLGVAPFLGRTFTAEEDRTGAQGTVVLSYTLWQNVFGGDNSILGRKVLLDSVPYTVIGVMPSDFYYPSREARLWTAMRFQPDAFSDRNNNYIIGIGRLRPGVSIEQAQAEMQGIAHNLARAYPKELAHTGANVARMRDELSSRTRGLLGTLLAAGLCVLLIACTNLANLLLTRALVRRRELAVRAALGAGRERLVRQMLTESLLLAAAGGVLGVALASSVLTLFSRLVPTRLPIAQSPSLDLRMLLFATVVTCFTGVAFGVFPALRACRGITADGLREGARSGIGGRREHLRGALVVAEVAGCIILLVCCGLLTRALWRIQSVDPGFRTDHVLTLRTSLPMPKYEEPKAREAFYARVLPEVRSLPGVTGAAYISFLPMVMSGGIWPVEIAGHPTDIANRPTASLRFVTPGYFAAMGIPLVSGRDVSDTDTMNSAFVALVSQSFVRRHWPKENPIGRHFDFGNSDRTVVGVVGDVRVRGLERESEPQVYLAYKQHKDVYSGYAPKDLVVRSSMNPELLTPALRQIILAADPEQPISDIRTMGEVVASSTASRAVQVRVLGAFTLTALLLAAIGIHGLLSFAVSNRTQEIGVRMALGARPGDIVSMTFGEGVKLASIGMLIGGPLAYIAARGLESLLAGVEPGDLITFSSAILFALLMTVAGTLLPSIRAARVDPAVAIRAD